jgi:DNA-binding response OmpR family regulator
MPSLTRTSSRRQAPDAGSSFSVAVLDEDPSQAASLVRCVQRAGNRCRAFHRRADLMQAMRSETFDLLILSFDDPDGGFAALTAHLRQRAAFPIPILALGAGAGELDLVAAVYRGADAYLPKPPSGPELAARASALMRRCYPMAHREVRDFGAYRFDMPRRTAFVDGEPVDLRGHEFDFAACLFANLGRPISHRYLTEAVFGPGCQIDNQTFRTIISRVRRKLGLQSDGPYQLRAVHSRGYRLHRSAEPLSAVARPPGRAAGRSAARSPT